MKRTLFMLILSATIIAIWSQQHSIATEKSQFLFDSAKICPVSKDEISGEGLKYNYLNQEHTFCNEGCVKAFKKNPAKYSSAALYDVVCDMDDGNKDINTVSNGVKYYFCNEGCKVKFEKDPDKYLERYNDGDKEQ